MPPEQRPLVRDLLLRLVAPSPGGEPVRSRVPRRIVATDSAHDELIELLVDARLVTSDDGVVELAHEALARAWPRLRDWLADDIEGQGILRRSSPLAGAAIHRTSGTLRDEGRAMPLADALAGALC